MQNETIKKLIVILGISFVIFWFIKPKKNGSVFSFNTGSDKTDKSEKKGFIKKPFLSEKDLEYPHLKLAYECLCAYIDAYNEGESEAALEAINNGFQKEIGIEIYTDENGKMAVKDASGNNVLVNG